MPKNVASFGKTSSIICKEVFDDGYQPSNEEICEYASHIGINPKTEPHLLFLAKEGLLQAIPPEWQICYNDDSGGYYYYNTVTKVRQWEHPFDAEYKSKVEHIRKSYAGAHAANDFSEDTSQIDSGIKSLQGDDSDLLTDTSPVTPSNTMRKMDLPALNSGRFLSPLEKRPSFSNAMALKPIESVRNKRFEITNNLASDALSAAPIGLAIKSNGSQESTPKTIDNNPTTSGFRGFTLSGKGSMFLKSTVKKADSEIDDAKFNEKNGEKNFRSILRDSNSADGRKRPESKKSDNELEDRKIVRFDLTKMNEANQGVYETLLRSDESSNEEENVDWDVEDDADERVDIESENELNDKPHKPAESSTSGLINMFEKRSQETGQIKPLYEDTDSESVTSIRSANNLRQNGEKELPKPSARDSNPFRKPNLNASTSKEGDSVDLTQFFGRRPSKPDVDVSAIRESLQSELDEKKKALELEFKEELKKFTKELDESTNDRKIELESQHNVNVEKFKQQLSEEFEEKRKLMNGEHRLAEEKLQENHRVILHELERDLKTETELIRKDHATNLQQMREQMKHDLEMEKQRLRESGESHLYEKIRCEKRLLEDKYRCLKDKYGRLKADVKLSLERRHQRREQQSITTGSETERTNSNPQSNDLLNPANAFKSNEKRKSANWIIGQKKTEQVSGKDRQTMVEKINKHGGATAKYSAQSQKSIHDDTSVSQSDTTISNNYQNNTRVLKADNGNSDSEAFQQESNNNYRDGHERQRKKTFTRMKSASTSRLNTKNVEVRPCTPVESLRRQLQKLDDLEDQFPDNSMEATYHLRYPFNVDSGRERGTSSTELEFFKHRIHLERDSVRRAKESLRVQKNTFQARQREIKHRHRTANRHNVEQMIQEERELTEMEVNLHRTRALLGEKVIRLKHLEQSLQRLYNEKPNFNQFNVEKDDTTVSDLSSHSSSGFSSTDFGSDLQSRKDVPTSEIYQTLESLNNEIREIWNILCQQQTQGLTPPPSMLYQDMNWRSALPTASLFPMTDNLEEQQAADALFSPPIPSLLDRLENYRQLASSIRVNTGSADVATNLKTMPPDIGVQQSMQNCTINLMERTQDLRNWLKKAKNEHELLRSGQQTDI